MLLAITTTREPATDIGFLLHKNPSRSLSFQMPFGQLHVFYPEASPERCTVALLLDIDPVEFVRGKPGVQPAKKLEQYVSDRPYVCSSFMSVALSRVFGQTLNGKCARRPELVDSIFPLACRISVLPCRGGEQFLRKLFEPLGYTVNAANHILDASFPEWGQSAYFTVDLFKETTLVELLNHLYVMIPVLDNQKHYYIDKAEIDKLLKRGEGWLSSHPEKEIIARRFLKNRSSYTREALDRLLEEDSPEEEPERENVSIEGTVEEDVRLNEERLGTVLSVLKACGAETVLDLGCGEGKLVQLLLKEKQFQKILGLDVSFRSLEKASERLFISDMPAAQKARVQLIQGSLMYRDSRLNGFDAAAIVEVVEHLDEPRLKAFERSVFEFAKPKTIALTTPNREYNVMWSDVGSARMRHKDHRFEWTRPEFAEWSARVAGRFGYSVRFLGVGREERDIGSPTQMAVFQKAGT